MKTHSLRLLFAGMLLIGLSTSCGTSSSLLSSGSSLMSALGKNANLSSFTKLLQTPGLDKLLGPAMKKPFTLLAPSNDALSSLGGDMLSNLTKPENASKLADMMKGQIVPGKLNPSDLMKGGLKTSGGKNLDLGDAHLGNVVSDQKFNLIPIDKLLK